MKSWRNWANDIRFHMKDTDRYTKVAEKLSGDPRVTVLTGAGISAASGVPTFRGEDGLWDEFDVDELATPQGFRKDPEKVWKWYDERRTQLKDVEPNPGHEVLAEWNELLSTFRIVTQNVDGLHEEAGAKDVIHLHGDIWQISCWDNCAESPERWENKETPLEDIPPRCPNCGGLVRPEVVWFGEQLDPEVLSSAQRALECDLFLTIGTSAEVHPAAGFIPRAKQSGAYTVEINPDSTSATSTVDLVIQEGAEEALPKINEKLS